MPVTLASPDRLTLEGRMQGQRIRMELALASHNTFLLVNRGFHWIQEYPINR